jgi:hypothetical protein
MSDWKVEAIVTITDDQGHVNKAKVINLDELEGLVKNLRLINRIRAEKAKQ